MLGKGGGSNKQADAGLGLGFEPAEKLETQNEPLGLAGQLAGSGTHRPHPSFSPCMWHRVPGRRRACDLPLCVISGHLSTSCSHASVNSRAAPKHERRRDDDHRRRQVAGGDARLIPKTAVITIRGPRSCD